MPDGPALVTIIIALIIALALASYLTVIAYLLHRTSFMLGTIIIGVQSIAHQTEPVGQVVDGIAQNISAIEQALGGLVPAEPSDTRQRQNAS